MTNKKDLASTKSSDKKEGCSIANVSNKAHHIAAKTTLLFK